MKKKGLVLLLIFIVILQIASPLTTVEVNETGLVSLSINAQDPDGAPLEYIFSEPLDENGEWKTNYGDAGNYSSTITVSDGELTTTEQVEIIVYRKEEPPIIDLIEPQTSELEIDEGGQIIFKAHAYDLNSDELKYLWELDGLTVGESDGFQYLSDYNSAGTHILRFSAADAKSATSQEWTINVNKVDRAKLLDAFNDTAIYEDKELKFGIPNFNAYNLEYSISEPVGNDGSWVPTYDEAGEYAVTIEIRDKDFTFQKEILITVLNFDRPPLFKGLKTEYVSEGSMLTVPISAVDADGDVIEIFGEELPKGSFIEDGNFSWTPDYSTVKKENFVTDVMDRFRVLSKAFSIKLIAASNELQTESSLKVVVKDVNQPFSWGEILPIEVKEGEMVEILPSAIDSDGDKIRYSYSGWMQSSSYLTNYDDSGKHLVKVSASDGQYSDSQFVEINVENVNRPPIFSEVEEKTASENSTMHVELNAVDPDGDKIVYSAKNLPKGATIKDDTFIWTPDFDAVKENEGKFEIIFTASDGELEAEATLIVDIKNKNRPPKIIQTSRRELTAKIGEPVTFEVKAEDPDGDELTYTWNLGLFENIAATEIHQRTFETTGDKEITVIVSDGFEYIVNSWIVHVTQ